MKKEAKTNNVLEVEVLISKKDLEQNPEILEIYDSESGKLKFELDKNIPKEFIKNLERIMPNFKSSDIIEFNPLINAVNMLQDIKLLIPNKEEEFEANERTLIDSNKVIGSFNSSLAKAKKKIKEPHIAFNKLVDDLFKTFSEEVQNTKNSLEENFKEIVEERERIKKEKEDKKRQKDLEQIKQLEETNTEMAEKMKIDKYNRACSEIESSINRIVVSVVEKIPSLNVDGLNTLKNAVNAQKETDLVSAEVLEIIGQEKANEYFELFKKQKSLAISQISSAINKIQMEEALKQKGIVQSPAVPSEALFETQEIPTIPSVNDIEVFEEQILKRKEPENDIEKFEAIAEFDKQMLEMYQAGVERIKNFKFDNDSLEILKNEYVEKQYGNLLGFLNKFHNYSSGKLEVVKQKLS